MGQTQNFRRFALGQALIIAQFNQHLLAFFQTVHGLQNGQPIKQLFAVIHRNIQCGISVLTGTVDGHRRLHNTYDLRRLCRIARQQLRQFANGRLPPLPAQKVLPQSRGVERLFLKHPADLHGAAVPKQALDLADDHRHCIGRERIPQGRVKPIHRLDQPHTAGLVQIVILNAPPAKAVGNGMHEPQVLADLPLPLRSYHFCLPVMRFSSTTVVPLPGLEVTRSLSQKLSITVKPSPARSPSPVV